MPLDTLVYAKLSGDAQLTALVAGRITPTTGTVNTQVPHLTYNTALTANNINLDGSSGVQTYSLTLDVYGITEAAVNDILTRSKIVLNQWRDLNDGVQWCMWESEGKDAQVDSEHYHGTQTFSIWYVE